MPKAKSTQASNRAKVPAVRLLSDAEFAELSEYEGATIGMWDPGAIAKQALGAEPEAGATFTYFYRRFGPPNGPTDAYKETACYFLATRLSGLVLCVSIRAPGQKASFAYLLNVRDHEAARSEQQKRQVGRAEQLKAWMRRTGRSAQPDGSAGTENVMAFECEFPRRDFAKTQGVLGEVHRALAAAFREMARPVEVRDSLFNVLGPVDSSEFTGRCADYHASGAA